MRWSGLSWWLLLSQLALACSVDTEPRLGDGSRFRDAGLEDDAGEDDAGDDDAGLDAGLDASVPSGSLLDVPAAGELGSLVLDEALVDFVYAGGLGFGLRAGSGVSVLDVSDASAPRVLSFLATSSRAVALDYDAARHIAYVLSVGGELRAYRVVDPTAPVRLASHALPAPEPEQARYVGFARVGRRVFALGGRTLATVLGEHAPDGALTLSDAGVTQVPSGAQRIAAGGAGLFIVFEGGLVRSFTAADAPLGVGETDLGAEITGFRAHGRRVIVGLRGLGLRVVELSPGQPAEVLADIAELDDVVSLAREGNLALVGLERRMVVALDLSAPAEPRAVARRDGTLPAWMAAAAGNLVLGSARELSVLGLPPFVQASVPEPMRAALPRHAPLSLQLSKAIVRDSVTVESVVLRCDGAAVVQSPLLSADGMRLTLVPSRALPPAAECAVELDGVQDGEGLALTASSALVRFTVGLTSGGAVVNDASSFEHTLDGRFTEWAAGRQDGYEYFDVESMQGAFGNVHVDYDGTQLWVLSDWLHGDSPLEPDCHQRLGVWTEGGTQRWDLRVYPDQRVEARIDGVRLAPDDERVLGGCAFGATPASSAPHVTCEVALRAGAGDFVLEVHGAGLAGSCSVLESEPLVFSGSATAQRTFVAAAVPAQPPPAPLSLQPSGDIRTVVPTLSWVGAQPPASGSTYRVQVAEAGEDGRVLHRSVVYGPSFETPIGLLQVGESYAIDVAAFNVNGVSDAATTEISVASNEPATPPELLGVDPLYVTQGTSATLTLAGGGFVEGAVVLFGSEPLATTFQSADTLTASLPASLTADVGLYPVSARNDPSDLDSQSVAIELEVVAACAHSECLPGAALAGVCSDCATAVCSQDLGCCDVSWDADCIALAEASASCSCNVPVLIGLSPDMGTVGAALAVTAELLYGAAGLTYELVLTPSGGGEETAVACAYTAAEDSCSANVPTSLPAGTYDAAVRVNSGSVSFRTEPVPMAFVQEPP